MSQGYSWNTQPHSSSPEDEDEEHEEHTEGGHVVHGLHENDELPAQSRHEANQLYHPQQPERPQHGETAIRLTDDLTHTDTHTHRAELIWTIYRMTSTLRRVQNQEIENAHFVQNDFEKCSLAVKFLEIIGSLGFYCNRILMCITWRTCIRRNDPECIFTHLMMTMMPSKMLYGFLRYSKKPNAVSLRIISSVNMLVKTILQTSSMLVSSSGWGNEKKKKWVDSSQPLLIKASLMCFYRILHKLSCVMWPIV